MAAKAYQKRKAQKARERKYVHSGMINLANGTWGQGVNDSMKRDMQGGYRVGQRRK